MLHAADGDIDLSFFSTDASLRDSWAIKLQSRLEEEQRSPAAMFKIGDVNVINAEVGQLCSLHGRAHPQSLHACMQVRLLKCLVDNIVVDISFNSCGGLCTLAFLENVDRMVSKDHLFKRSIILVNFTDPWARLSSVKRFLPS